MSKICYVPAKGGTLLQLSYGSNHAVWTSKKGEWREAVKMSLMMGVLPQEYIAMFTCYMFQHWPVYDYLCQLGVEESITIFKFILILAKTKYDGSIKTMKSGLFFLDGTIVDNLL